MYIAFVGIDGVGKTTIINRIQDSGMDAVFTREPYYNIPKTYNDPVEASYEFAKDRYRHMKDVIIPAKEAGKHIISDRCYLCNLAYQSHDGLIDLQWLMGLQPLNLVFPDAVIWMQSDPNIAAKRSGEDAWRLSEIQHIYAEVINSRDLPRVNWYLVTVDEKSPDEVYVEVALLISELMRDNGR
ncbi:MAG: hypothetical protein PHS80_00135 [Methanothrix sp.]|nr:hypothetical protein [Methanothrix sp.]